MPTHQHGANPTPSRGSTAAEEFSRDPSGLPEASGPGCCS
jgi:hypothetical protein